MPLSILFIERKMMNNRFEKKEKKEKIIYAGEYSDRNNWCWGFPEYMEEYRLARGYEWRDGLLREKVDPRCLNEHGIPTNDFNLPAVPGMNTLPMNARIATKNRYLSQIIVKWACMAKGISSWGNLESALTTTHFKKEYHPEDFNFLLWYEWGTANNHWTFTQAIINTFPSDRKAEIFWKPAVSTRDGDIIINKNWTYIVQFYADFTYKYPRDTNRLDKAFIFLMYNGKVWVRMQQRTCATTDWVQWLYIWWLKKWDRLNIACAVAFTDNDVRETYCATAINIVETS